MHTMYNISVPSSLLLDSGCNYLAKLVCCVLYARQTKAGVTASLRELARTCNVCISTIRKALQHLITAGYLTRLSAPREQGAYKLHQDNRSVMVSLHSKLLYNVTYTVPQKVIYAILAAYRAIGHNDGCYPSYRTLSHVSGLCIRTVQYAIHTLRERNVITTKLVYRPTYYPYTQYTFLRDYPVADVDLAMPRQDSAYHLIMLYNAAEAQKQTKRGEEKEKTCDKSANLDTGIPNVVLTLNKSDCSNYISSIAACQAEITTESLQAQLHYDWLTQYINKSDADLCIRCLVDYLRKCKHKPIVLRGQAYDYATMRDAVLQLTQYHVLYAMTQYRSAAKTRKIRYAASYLTSILLNSLTDLDAASVAASEYDPNAT